jgi:large repetitive protein
MRARLGRIESAVVAVAFACLLLATTPVGAPYSPTGSTSQREPISTNVSPLVHIRPAYNFPQYNGAHASAECHATTCGTNSLSLIVNSAVVVFVGAISTTAPSGVNDTLHNVWTAEGHDSSSVNANREIYVYLASNSTATNGTADHVTVNFTATTYYNIAVEDLSFSAIPAFDAIGAGTVGSIATGGSSTSGTFSTTVTSVCSSCVALGGAETVVYGTGIAMTSVTANSPSSSIFTGLTADSDLDMEGTSQLPIGPPGTQTLGFTGTTNAVSSDFAYAAIGITIKGATVPTAPSSLAHGTTTATTIPTSWTNPVGPFTEEYEDYAVYSGAACGSYTILQLSPYTASHILTGLTPDTGYCIKVYLENETGNSSQSNLLSNIKTQANLGESITAAPATTQVGELSMLDLTITGGYTPYSWTLTRNGSASNLTGAVINTPHGANYSASFLHGGSYIFYFNITDNLGATAAGTVVVMVDAALVATIGASKTSNFEVGDTSTLTLTEAGGVPTLTWSLHLNGSSSNISGVTGSSSPFSYAFTPVGSGTYVFYYNATDHVGSTSKVTVTVAVVPALTTTFSSSPGTTQVGETSTLSYAFSNGETVRTWTLARNGSSSNLTGAGASSYTFTPTHPATYTFYWNVTDARSVSVKKTATVVVKAALVATLSAAPSLTQVGEPSVLSYSFAGGVTPITWTLARNGSGLNLSGAAASSYSASFVHAGSYVFYLNATDAVGSASKVTTTVTVDAALVATLTASRATTQISEASVLSYSFAGGVPTITWTLTCNGSASNLTGAVGGHYAFNPIHVATFTFYLNSTDAVGSVSKVTTTVDVKPALVATLSASLPTTEVGQGDTLLYSLAGGVAPVTWTLTRNGSGSNLTGASGGSYTFAAIHAATFVFYLNATDAVGSTSDKTTTVVVRSALFLGIASNVTTFSPGGDAQITLTVSGGVYPVVWTLDLNSSAMNRTGVTGGSGGIFYYNFTTGHAAFYSLYFNGTDALGASSKGEVIVVVVSFTGGFIFDPSSPYVLQSILFVPSVQGGAQPYSYKWTFVGFTTSTNQTPSFVWTVVGTYSVNLVITDARGVHVNVTETVGVTPAPGPTGGGTVVIPWDSLIFISFIISGFWAVFTVFSYWRKSRERRKMRVPVPRSGTQSPASRR